MFAEWHIGDNYPHRPQDRGFETVVAQRGEDDMLAASTRIIGGNPPQSFVTMTEAVHKFGQARDPYMM